MGPRPSGADDERVIRACGGQHGRMSGRPGDRHLDRTLLGRASGGEPPSTRPADDQRVRLATHEAEAARALGHAAVPQLEAELPERGHRAGGVGGHQAQLGQAEQLAGRDGAARAALADARYPFPSGKLNNEEVTELTPA